MVATSSPGAQTLTPLVCPACGSTLPLSEADSVPCPYCGASVPVPEAHRHALKAEESSAATRQRAQELYRVLGRPPSRALKVMAAMFNGIWLSVGGFCVVMIAIALGLEVAFREVGGLMHQQVTDTVPVAVKDAIFIPVWFGLFLFGVALGVMGRRRVVGLRGLQSALAARPPSLPGGPSTCRVCGAPLTVPDDALGVRCIYCKADNLVALPPGWTGAVEHGTAAVAKEIEIADASYQAEKRRLRRQLWYYLGVAALALAVLVAVPKAFTCMFGVFIIGVSLLAGKRRGVKAPRRSTTRSLRYLGAFIGFSMLVAGIQLAMQKVKPGFLPPNWTARAIDPRPVLRRRLDPRRPQTWSSAIMEPVMMQRPCASGHGRLVLEPADCRGRECTVYLYAALRHDERARLRARNVAPGTSVTIERHQGYPWPSYPGDVFGPRVGDLQLARDGFATFRPDVSAWYELRLHLPGARPGNVDLCFEVTRP
jgi:hypothetical protein